MVQDGKNQNRIGGKDLIQESDHLSEIVQRQNSGQPTRQVQQGQAGDRQRQQGQQDFNYENPRQVH